MMGLRDKIDRTIRASQRPYVGFVVIVCVALVFVGSSLRFLRGYFGETVIVTEDALTRFSGDMLPVFKAQIIGTQAIPSSLVEEVTTRIGVFTFGPSTTAHFGLLRVGDHVLLVKSASSIRENIKTYSGVLVLSGENSVARDVYNEMLIAYPTLREGSLPLILDLTYPIWWWFGGLAAEAVVLGAALFLVWRAIQYRNPNNHPLIKTLARFGDVDMVIAEIERQMVDENESDPVPLHITPDWLVSAQGPLQIMHLSEVVWVYKYRENDTSIVRIWDRHGQQIGVAAIGDWQADALVTAVSQRTPWAFVGTDSIVEKMWKKDRRTFMRLVDERRTEKRQPSL